MPRTAFRLFSSALFLLALTIGAAEAAPGFYVAPEEADKKPESASSTVVMAYDSGRMVMSFSSPLQGETKDLALIIPAPGTVRPEQIRPVSGDLFNKLQNYSALRLTGSEDPSPCTAEGIAAASSKPAEGKTIAGIQTGARLEEGDYDIAILEPAQSATLSEWLKEKGYRLPKGTENFFKPYIGRQYSFIIAKPRLPEGAGPRQPRPLQLAYNASKFALPLRLAAIHAPLNTGGEQDLVIFALTRGGKVEAANLRNTLLPEGKEVPEFVVKDFSGFAEALHRRTALIDSSSAMLEFSGDALSCAACAAPAPTPDELRELGALWLEKEANKGGVWLTRLHLRYRPGGVPDDLELKETQNREAFQPRFIVRKAWKGDDSACPAAAHYKQAALLREKQMAQGLARLTGWPLADISVKMGIAPAAPQPGNDWWKELKK